VSAWIDDPGRGYSPARYQPTLLPKLRPVPPAEEPILWGRALPSTSTSGESSAGDVFGLERESREDPAAVLRPTAGAVPGSVIETPEPPAASRSTPRGAFSAALSEAPPAASRAASEVGSQAPVRAEGPRDPVSSAPVGTRPSAGAVPQSPAQAEPVSPAPARRTPAAGAVPQSPARGDGPWSAIARSGQVSEQRPPVERQSRNRGSATAAPFCSGQST